MSLDKFELFLQNKPIDVTSYSVSYDMFTGAGSFEAEVDHTEVIDLTKHGVSFEVCINDQSMMVGFLEKVNRKHSKGSISQTISGRDMCQVLIDNYIMQPQVYPGKPIKTNSVADLFNDSSVATTVNVDTLIRNVWDSSKSVGAVTAYPVSVNKTAQTVAGVKLPKPLTLPEVNFPVYAPNATNRKLFVVKKIRTGHGQSIFEFCSHLLNGLGLYMYNVPGTLDILIHAIQANTPVHSYDKSCKMLPATEPGYVIKNIPGDGQNNVIDASFTQDTSNYYTFFRFIGQCESEFEDTDDSAVSYLLAEKVIPGYSGINKFKATKINVLDANVWNKEQERLINNEFMDQNKSLYGFKYTLAGHSPDGVNPYFFNHVAVLSDEYLHISNQSLLVYSVEYKGSKSEGQTTTLGLYSPEAVPNMISNADIS